MKKYILLALFLFLCLGISACKKDNDGIDLSQIYLFEVNYNDNGVFYKYNAQTGSYSTVCTDPLCKHDRESDCKFYGVFTTVINGDWLYFTKKTRIYTEHDMIIRDILCAYNYTTDKYDELYIIEESFDSNQRGFQWGIEYNDGYVYFFQETPDADINDWMFSRINVSNKKVEYLCSVPPQSVQIITEKELICLEEPNKIYKTDLYYKSRVDLIETPKLAFIFSELKNNNFVYYESVDSLGFYEPDDPVPSGELYRVDIKSGKSEKLFDMTSIRTMQIIGDRIYFLQQDIDPPPRLNSNGEIMFDARGEIQYNSCAGKIYRAKLDGSGIECIYENGSKMINSLRSVGKYLVADGDLSEKIVIDTMTSDLIRG